MTFWGRSNALFIATLMTFFVAGCATTPNVKQVDRLDAVEGDPVILVMTPDVKYYLLTTGGIPQPHAEWTEAARVNFTNSLIEYADEHEVQVKMMDESSDLDELEIAYQKLYSAVGTSILIHHFGATPLPTKEGSFDWSLGPGISEIGEKYGVEYALFSYYRDYQASGGRVAFAVLAAVAGVGMSAGWEAGFASLVDLRNGDIVWFNQLTANVGELNDEKSARAVVDNLFKDLPGT